MIQEIEQTTSAKEGEEVKESKEETAPGAKKRTIDEELAFLELQPAVPEYETNARAHQLAGAEFGAVSAASFPRQQREHSAMASREQSASIEAVLRACCITLHLEQGAAVESLPLAELQLGDRFVAITHFNDRPLGYNFETYKVVAKSRWGVTVERKCYPVSPSGPMGRAEEGRFVIKGDLAQGEALKYYNEHGMECPVLRVDLLSTLSSHE